MLRLVIYEDNAELRESLSILLRGSGQFAVAGCFENCAEVVKHMQEFSPDLVLMDIDMPVVDGLEGLRRIKKHYPSVPVLILTVFDDDKSLFEAICQGAVGYLLKATPPHKLIEAIFEAYQGGSPMTSHIARRVLQLFSHQFSPPPTDYKLTGREREILAALVRGQSYKMIAAGFEISIDTVRAHIKKIYEKLQVHSQTEAVSKALKEHLI